MTFSANPRCDEFVGFIHELADAARAVLAIVHADDFGGAPLASV